MKDKSKVQKELKAVVLLFSKHSGIMGGMMVTKGVWTNCFRLNKDVDKLNRVVRYIAYIANPSNRN